MNGYKISRADPLHRIVIGRIYHHTVKLLFGLSVRDVTAIQDDAAGPSSIACISRKTAA